MTNRTTPSAGNEAPYYECLKCDFVGTAAEMHMHLDDPYNKRRSDAQPPEFHAHTEVGTCGNLCPTCRQHFTIWHGSLNGVWRDCPDEFHNGHDGEPGPDQPPSVPICDRVYEDGGAYTAKVINDKACCPNCKQPLVEHHRVPKPSNSRELESPSAPTSPTTNVAADAVTDKSEPKLLVSPPADAAIARAQAGDK